MLFCSLFFLFLWSILKISFKSWSLSSESIYLSPLNFFSNNSISLFNFKNIFIFSLLFIILFSLLDLLFAKVLLKKSLLYSLLSIDFRFAIALDGFIKFSLFVFFTTFIFKLLFSNKFGVQFKELCSLFIWCVLRSFISSCSNLTIWNKISWLK